MRLSSFFVITHIIFRAVLGIVFRMVLGAIPGAVLGAIPGAVLGAVLGAESDIDIRVRRKSLYNSSFPTTPDVPAMQAFTASS